MNSILMVETEKFRTQKRFNQQPPIINDSLFFQKFRLFDFVVKDVMFLFNHSRFFHKRKKSTTTDIRRLKMFEIYRFADTLDIFLMILGTIVGEFY